MSPSVSVVNSLNKMSPKFCYQFCVLSHLVCLVFPCVVPHCDTAVLPWQRYGLSNRQFQLATTSPHLCMHCQGCVTVPQTRHFTVALQKPSKIIYI